MSSIKALFNTVQALPEADRAYALRFARANAHLSEVDFLTKWEQDQVDRAEAAAIETHRREKVIREFMALGDVTTEIAGIQATADAGEGEA